MEAIVSGVEIDEHGVWVQFSDGTETGYLLPGLTIIGADKRSISELIKESPVTGEQG